MDEDRAAGLTWITAKGRWILDQVNTTKPELRCLPHIRALEILAKMADSEETKMMWN
jgi:hypothetical protein